MDKTLQEIALTQLRKSVQKLGSSTELKFSSLSSLFFWFAKVWDPTLMRFLIARSMDPAKAEKMFIEWQKWRTSPVPNGSIPDSEVEDALGPRKIFLHGLSKDGYPVLLVKANRHFFCWVFRNFIGNMIIS
ncbi:SEC14 CYTOSOLIC FACTOR-LIKE [Salix koriyanagi]|uniref:SEC14 CYTOSOLIC FACTOR-LIKE n=1 Tax=Salix koriyanagi TaxID=2511006 RepID=A0A9Q0WR08_9ROSI|nr:SEC14 CYTOSOLIC FACTOR-LIKE [Salix koriyanagi]